MKHGSRSTYVNQKCRCEGCTEANFEYNKQRRQNLKKNTPFDQIPHGTGIGYNDYLCRCDECTKAMTAKVRGYEQARMTEPGFEIPHGTSYGYRSYGCRCDVCLEAASARYTSDEYREYHQDYRATKKNVTEAS